MEILIPGLILVALMIYASTKIKKSAAQAFEAESFAGEGFSLEKPDGFIIPADFDEGLLFEAYTKDSGTQETEMLRQARAEVRRFEGTTIDELRKAVADSSEVLSEDTRNYSLSRAVRIEAKAERNGVPLLLFYLIASGGNDAFQLEVTALPENIDEFSERIDILIESFSLD